MELVEYLLDTLPRYFVDLWHVVSITNDQFENEVLAPLRGYNQKIALYVNDDTVDIPLAPELHRLRFCRFRRILHTIAANKFFVEIEFGWMDIPGALFAEWIRMNQSVTEISYPFDCEEGVHELALAIKNDTIIRKFCIKSMEVGNYASQVLGEAFRENICIQSLKFDDEWRLEDSNKIFLENGIAFNKHIKHLEINIFEIRNEIDLETINSVLKGHSSLTSLGICLDEFQESVTGGLLLSPSIKKVKLLFRPLCSHGLPGDLFLVRSIRNMKHVEQLKVFLLNFKGFSSALSRVLRESHASIQLVLVFNKMEQTDKDLLSQSVQEISSWERQPRIEIEFSMFGDAAAFDYSDWKILHEFRLTKLKVWNPSEATFLALIDELPNMKELKCFQLEFSNETLARQIVIHHNKLAAAIRDNCSIQEVKTDWTWGVQGNSDAEKWIKVALRDNKLRAEISASKSEFPLVLLPALMEYGQDDTDFQLHLVKKYNGLLFHDAP